MAGAGFFGDDGNNRGFELWLRKNATGRGCRNRRADFGEATWARRLVRVVRRDTRKWFTSGSRALRTSRPRVPATRSAASDQAWSNASTRLSLVRSPSSAGAEASPRSSAEAAKERKRRSASVSGSAGAGAAGPRLRHITCSISWRRETSHDASSRFPPTMGSLVSDLPVAKAGLLNRPSWEADASGHDPTNPALADAGRPRSSGSRPWTRSSSVARPGCGPGDLASLMVDSPRYASTAARRRAQPQRNASRAARP